MHRRGFLLGLAGMAGTVVAAGALLTPAQATTLSQLKDLAPPDGEAEAMEAVADEAAEAATPDGTPVDRAQWGPPPRGYYRRRRRRRSRRVCRRAWDRWGRPYRRCRRVWY